jgi:hypothetical protein
MPTIVSLTPAAWWGLIAIAVPILVHLFVRGRAPRVRFPSLRFIPAAPVAAVRVRLLSDRGLLLVRAGIVALAVWALTGPVVVTDARREAWSHRVVRALVVAGTGDGVEQLAVEEARGVFAHARFAAPVLADAVRDAAEWLDAQPPAARELVVVGDLREGALTQHDLAAVPRAAGIRFVTTAAAAERATINLHGIASLAPGSASAYRAAVTATREETRVAYGREQAPVPVRTAAASGEERRAEELLEAVLRDGVLWGRRSDRQLTLAFDGSPLARQALAPASEPWMLETLAAALGVRGGVAEGRFVVVMPVPASDPGAAQLIARIVRAAYAESLDDLEPRRIPRAQLDAWSRPPAGLPADVPLRDEGDRRWIWLMVPLLLIAEHTLRRGGA